MINKKEDNGNIKSLVGNPLVNIAQPSSRCKRFKVSPQLAPRTLNVKKINCVKLKKLLTLTNETELLFLLVNLIETNLKDSLA